MLKNYFKIALRNLQRNKVYSFINIAGLSLGLACAMLIILYVKDEVSYDRFHHNVNQIYRIVSTNYFDGKEHKDGVTGYLQGPRFTQNVPGIETFTRVQQGTEDIKTGTEIKSQDLLYADSSFFNVFTFPLIHGNPKTCLKEPHSVVISEKEAKKRFGTTDALGKIILVKTDSTFTPYSVSAVAKNTPQNSSIQFDMLLPLKESEEDAGNKENWYNFFLNTFVVLSPKATAASVEKGMQQYYEKDASQVFNEMKKKFGLDPNLKMGTYHLQSFADIHMSTDLPAQNGLQNGSNPIYSYILSGIALFVLLIACINFVNLTVARSVKRAKEIGIRKVVGGSRKQLIFQFLGESFLLCFIAFVMAVVLVQLILPVFNELSNKALSISYLFDARLILVYVILFFLTSFLAGFYPALILSSYQPTATLYSRFSLGGKNYLQKSLVVLQFALASFLITGTFVIYSQFQFLTNTNLGYDDNNIVEVSNNIRSHEEAAVFKQELLKNPDIMDVAPKNGGGWNTMAKIDNDSSIQFAYETVDESYIPMMKIQLLQGRNFLKDYPSDSTTSVIINEAFAKQAGWKDPIGKSVNFFFNKELYSVIGVVKDYHYEPLNEKIKPQLFTMKNSNKYGLYDIKIRPETASQSLKFIHQKFKDLYPMSPYSYVFKDEQNRKNYEAEAKWKQIMLFAAILTIFISCIGLFGLSVLSAEKRIKEIGIRKVLGASVSSVVTTLSKDFLKLVIIAMIIAIPAAWLVAGKWLENYPYRIALSWWIFALAGILVILIALATVSFQAIKAAVANPADSLRTE
jgi:putative ABC transport system permease protein